MSIIYAPNEYHALCYKLAVKNDAVYYALQNGIDCHFGPKATYAMYGTSSDCTMKCNQDTNINGPICGGINANSVYQISVSCILLILI